MRHAWLVLLLAGAGTALGACSNQPLMDPLGIGDMRQRCKQQEKRGEAPEDFKPVPFLACRDVPGL